MEATAPLEPHSVQQDEQFIKWIMSKEAEKYWAFDRHGKRLKLTTGWDKAQKEYDRIMGLKEKDLKVYDIQSSIE
jgi:hypothetical protein